MLIRHSLFLATCLWFCCFAQSASDPKASSSKPTVKAVASVQDMTCADLLFMFGDEKQAQDSTYLMMWAYGLKTGASGVDLQKYPLTEEGLKIFVRGVVDTCKTKSDAKLISILTGKAGK